jgi:autotransporter-associated beta strand protein
MNVGVQLSSDLTAAITANSLTINGVVSGAGNLTKTGTGTLTLTAANSYTGDTRVQAGRLALGVASLADSADVYVASGSQLVLNFGGNPDTIDALFLNGISQPPGIWGAIGSGAQFTSSLLLGTGMLKVTTFVAPPLVGDYNQDGVVNTADYVVWRSSIGLATLPNRDPGNSGKVEQADYATWRAKFGNSSLNSAAYANQLSVPEPGTITIACGIVFAAFLTSRQLRRSF